MAGEVLAAAAAHSVLSDELAELERQDVVDTERCAMLRARRLEARRRHDEAERRLRSLTRHLRAYVVT